MDRFDVIIIGMGVGGEAAAGRLLAAGRRVAVIERELIGGECAYWACIPSKTLLRGPEARAEASRAAGVATPAIDWPGLRDYHDYMIRQLDDTAQVEGYEQAGATVVKGPARLTGPGRVEAGGQLLEADHVVIATGSLPLRPPVEGLDQVPVWTNREATNVRDMPARVLLVGGSAVGVELGQFYAGMGAQVTIVQRAGRLVDREDPRVGELAAQALSAQGVTVHTGVTPVSARAADQATVVTLDDGSQVETDVVILGVGRRPATDGFGLEAARVQLTGRGGIAVDHRCQAGPGLWAAGDVTGIALFTHVATYQGRVVAACADPAGVTELRHGALERVGLLLADWRDTQARLADTGQRMLTVLGELGLTGLVTSITGLSAVGAASILAETGDPRRFTSGRALVKHAGLAPRQKNSGSYAGRTRMTGQGRPALRLAAWRAVWGALKSNPVYAARFAHLTGREHDKLSTGQAHAALAAALLRHLHAIITTGQRWDPVIAAGGRPDQTLNAA